MPIVTPRRDSPAAREGAAPPATPPHGRADELGGWRIASSRRPQPAAITLPWEAETCIPTGMLALDPLWALTAVWMITLFPLA